MHHQLYIHRPSVGNSHTMRALEMIDRYLFDHRNGSMLQQWFIEEFVGGPDGIDSPHIE